MSIVEKAVERLREGDARQAERRRAESDSSSGSSISERPSSIDRLGEAEWETTSARAAETARVDWEKARRLGYLIEGESGARLDDELRRIKRRLLGGAGRAGAAGPQTSECIMVTSAGVGEGKTFTAVNLAINLAKERDVEVVLVDADIPKHDLSRLFGLEQEPGLIDALTDERCRPEELLVRATEPGLLVLPAGPYHDLSPELMNSARMDQVVHILQAGARRRIVVFDSSPLLATAAAPVLASHMGQVIMVVAAGRTPQQTVRSALETLDGVGSISLLLNMARLPAGERHYDRYYYYGRHGSDR